LNNGLTAYFTSSSLGNSPAAGPVPINLQHDDRNPVVDEVGLGRERDAGVSGRQCVAERLGGAKNNASTGPAVERQPVHTESKLLCEPLRKVRWRLVLLARN
jgi:hypothetical protein